MDNLKELDDELYKAKYVLKNNDIYNTIWNRIKGNVNILRDAVQIKRDKFDERDIVKGLAVAEEILINYDTVDSVAYNNLIDMIYSNTDIARIVLDGAANGGYSFLLMSLWNHQLKLSDNQKAFAVDEAMNKIGTTRWQQKDEDFSKKLDDMGISDDNVVFINIDGCINPVGQKTASEYMNYKLFTLSEELAHGVGEFDIRYHILRNPNWTLEEKQKLIMDFWYDDDVYDEFLELWEWGIINDSVNYKDNSDSLMDKSYLYDYTYQELLDFYQDKKTTDRIWEEIEFCKLMHKLRPQQWEIDTKKKKRII